MSRSGSQGFLANPSFRAHLLWVVTGTTAALLVFGSAVILLPLFLRFESSLSAPEELGRLADRILVLHETLWPFVLLCLAAVMASSWLLYQRMVSPMTRFVQVFRAVGEGRIPGPVVLRATDYLTEEADALNAMTAALRARHVDVAAAETRLRESLEEIAEWAAAHPNAELAQSVALLQDREKSLADQISRLAVG